MSKTTWAGGTAEQMVQFDAFLGERDGQQMMSVEVRRTETWTGRRTWSKTTIRNADEFVGAARHVGSAMS